MRFGLNTHDMFPLGQVVATHGVLHRISVLEMTNAITRHQRGDWGDVCSEDAMANQEAIHCASRIISNYKTASGIAFWIITEADRSSTCILLPEEY